MRWPFIVRNPYMEQRRLELLDAPLWLAAGAAVLLSLYSAYLLIDMGVTL